MAQNLTVFWNKNMILKKILCCSLGALPLKHIREYGNSLLSVSLYGKKNCETLCQSPHSADEATVARKSNRLFS